MLVECRKITMEFYFNLYGGKSGRRMLKQPKEISVALWTATGKKPFFEAKVDREALHKPGYEVPGMKEALTKRRRGNPSQIKADVDFQSQNFVDTLCSYSYGNYGYGWRN